ncbi:MAG: hypothetical protein JXB45_11920 [Candidatus Krumholzibacteriota bacterium]|nr:hypothetical protein [Candidatus Krumholzibacteriota bacterium]
MKVTGIGMVSGGLDSLLAVLVLKRQGISIRGLHFTNGFHPGDFKRRIYEGATVVELAEERARKYTATLGVPVEAVDISGEFLELLLNPVHGYGKHLNPCIDCRIFLLRKARERMEKERADFIFSGEVLGQRPMSQRLGAMKTVERESGLDGYLLRPLCAKHLPPTEPEKNGLVDRDRLLDLRGRSRKRQLELAREWGVGDYGQPAGGCALTDENYTRRLKDFIDPLGDKNLAPEDVLLLSVGRHFRLPSGVKCVVGRNEAENVYLERNWKDCWLAEPLEHPGPTVLIRDDPGQDDFKKAASLLVRYSDGRHLPAIRVMISRGEERIELLSPPLEEDYLDQWRV